MKKRTLEMELQHLSNFSNPKAELEQYITPAPIAAEILHFALGMGDVVDKSIADFGSGPGIFGIGACILGAKVVHAVEIDPDAVEDLKKNILSKNCKKIIIHEENVEKFAISVDTVFQNTPFGAQSRHADIPFLKAAMMRGKVIYSLHNASTRDFVIKKINDLGGKVTHIREFDFFIPKIYSFHRKDRVRRKFIFFRIEKEIV